MTLNIWRQGRNQEGWLTSEAKKKARLGTKEPDGDPPKFVRMVPRFFTDIQVLVSLTAMDSPPNIPVRASNDKAIYIVGDASGSGFGSVRWIQDGEVVDAQFGNWKWEVTENESSNFRESANLVHSLRTYLKSGRIEQGSEVFICTDNAVAESTYFKGSSKSSKLHELIVDLRRLEMEGDLIVHFLWISGKRMIKQGTDGLSRGDFHLE